MKLTLEEVEHIADLARLCLTQEEKRKFAEQLSDILGYAARLESVNTDQIPPTANVLNMVSRLREDHPRPGLTQDEVLHNAPETKDGQFKVPPVFKG